MNSQDNTKTQTPTEAFDQALRGLSKVPTPFLSEEETSSALSESTEQPVGFRDELMDVILKRHPKLTREELEQQMMESGF
jgi:hypothetical protein